jgi:hypothetical protein
MARTEIPKLLEESKKALAAEHAASVKGVRKELASFKKKTLSKV